MATETVEELNNRFADALLPLTITFGLFTICGVVGNSIVLIVFSLGRAYRNNNFRVFVLCLAVVDLLTSAIMFPSEMAKHRNYYNFKSVPLCGLKVFINMWAAVAAALSLLIVCIDRYRKVCRPLETQMSQRLAVKLCVGLTFGLAFVVAIPGPIISGIKEANKTNIYGNDTLVYICTYSEKYNGHPVKYVYQLLTMLILITVSVSTIVMYILIGRQIYMHWGALPLSFRQDSGKESHSDYTSDSVATHRTTTSSLKASAENSPMVNHKDLPVAEITLKEQNHKVPESPRNKRPPLVKQGSASFDRDNKVVNKKLISQISNASFASRSSKDSSSRHTTMSRQGSRFGVRRFPYKTLIWFILTLVFVATNVLSLALAFAFPDLLKLDANSYAVYSSFYRLYLINNVINPFVYTLLDKHFRQVCRNIGPRLRARFAECCS